jgi:DNA-binding NarL/FixJ family response regulator
VTQSLVGRTTELTAVEQELATGQGGMACIAIEGEPGIGKTRLLLSIEERARAGGYVTMTATADEEIRGPFLLARSIFASPSQIDGLEGTPAGLALDRIVDALSNRDDPGLESLPPDRKLLRIFDLAAGALRALSLVRPVAILIDDLQWADDDSLRLLRYVVRADAASRILLVVATRPSEVAFVQEAVTLLADLERMGFLRRIRLGRFSQADSTDFLHQVLGGRINASSAAIMHAQAEGVPFILAEQAHAYRDAGLIQQVDGVWTLARNAERLLPSSVRTLIQRRAARLPDETNACLAQAAVLGRSFSLRDLREVKAKLGENIDGLGSLAEVLQPAVEAGLLIQHDQRSAADYGFTHDQIREYATAGMTPPRRRAVHKAVVDMLLAGGEPPPGSLPLLALHALAAGETEFSVRFSVDAARAALEAHAPEEVLRLVEAAHPIATDPHDRVALLCLRDDALEMLRRPGQRLEGLAELSALTEALGDSSTRLSVMLRRAAALRLSGDHDRAAEIARRVRAAAEESSDREAELAACLELGQDFLRTEIGEGYAQTPHEADLDGAEEAYRRAEALAEKLNDEARLAAAIRELGIISLSRFRAWFVERVMAGEHLSILERVAAGETVDDILPTLPTAYLVIEANQRFLRALEIYEKLGDRRGAMSTIIAMAFARWGAEIHTSGSAKRIEEIRRLSTRLKSLTRESEREAADAQMIFGVHVYAGAKGFPDVAIAKGHESYDAARSLGDLFLEFASAGGVAMVHAEMAEVDEANRWLDRAAAVAAAAPTPYRARQLELWRGSVRAAAGDAQGMRDHLERAVRLATDHGRAGARAEALAWLALESGRLGAGTGDGDILSLAERSAQEARQAARGLPGNPPYGPQAKAVLARVALARGDVASAVEAAREALTEFDGAFREDLSLDIILPASEALLAGGTDAEVAAARQRLRLTLAMLVQRITDEDVRVRWFRGPVGRELTSLAGVLDEAAWRRTGAAEEEEGDPAERQLLQLLAEGRTNLEIARELGTTEELVARQLSDLYVKLGVSSRTDATAFALTRN